ncbi:MAG: hypothetical protein JWQ89_1134 [Devosia sp.]|uniref:DUF1499 domain-containing protein n=1 Tax=Devosia sp. TaxID=1871048 RepID=UPI00260D4854|nr:DUF1499 domain-containing protein [Devosia sp.]MDB5539407.1 hypothetical protein [Devosia sp.]
MRILIRTSKWAIWSRRLGSLALPLTIIPILLHREQMIPSSDFAVIEAVAGGVAALTVFLGIGAFVRLWMTGDRGWSRAGWGLFFGLSCLLPFAWLGLQATQYPMLNEVTTDVADPLPLTSPIRVAPTSAALRDKVEATFPNARTRSYPIDATEMFTIVEDLVEARGWEVRTRRAPPTALDVGQINAIAVTLFGWRDEVAIRVTGTAQGSTIDMRSVPLSGLHDFGENGKRVEEFLLALDQKITLTLRDAPQAPTTPDTETPPPPAETEPG